MIEELIYNIANTTSCNTAIFCGAGVSYHSGLPLVNNLVKKIFEVMQISAADTDIILNSDMPFEAFVETIRNEVSVDEILEIFAKGMPNTTHELIAELVSLGFTKTVMTTNFDSLIENALINKGLQKDKDFNVFSSETAFEKINWSDNSIKIIKIHGCISDKEEMAITMSAVANKASCTNKNNTIDNFFSRYINTNVVIMGYSCSDLFDISPRIEDIKNENSSNVFLIEHAKNTSDYTVEDIALKDYKNPFKNFSGQRIFIDSDFFIKNVWETLITVPYEFQSNQTPWEENVEKWMRQAIETNSAGVINHLPARLYYNIGEYKIAVKHFEQGMYIAQKDGNRIMFYSELGNLGMAFNALGKYKEAKNCLEESSTACRDLGNVQGEIAQLQALGNIYRNLSEYEAAIIAYNRAIMISERERDITSLCNSLGNAASAYNHTNRPDEAIKYLNRGIKIAFAIGDKQSEGSMLCSFGIAYSQKGDNEKAKQFIQNSINTTRMIGDKQGECMALHNLSNINLNFKEFDECLKNATSSLQIAQEIGMMPSIAQAYYNIGNCYFFKGDLQLAIQNLNLALDISKQIYGAESSQLIPILKIIFQADNYREIMEFGKVNHM